MDNKSRAFRKIPSLKYLFEINSDGTILRNVKSKKRVRQYKHSHNSKTKYWSVDLMSGRKSIHNLVAECWLGPKPEGCQTDHIDKNSLNNDYRNLRYVTKSEQMLNRDYSKFQDKLLKNLASRNGGKLEEVILKRNGEEQKFSSTVKAARFLTTIYPEKKEKSFKDKFYCRRSHIFDYDISYREYYPKV